MTDVKDYPPYLDHPKERKKQTNADRIRQMSDEELANLFESWIQDCGCNAVPCQKICEEERINIFQHKSCKDCWLDWLKQEVRYGN